MDFADIKSSANIIIDRVNALEQELMQTNITTWPTSIDCLSSTPPSQIPGMNSNQQNISYYNIRNDYLDRIHQGAHPGSIIFIGDSLFDGMSINDITPFGINMGIGGDTLRGVINRIHRTGLTNALHRAGAGVLLIGINDIYYEGDNYNINIPYMLDMLSSCLLGKWVICHVLPVNEDLFGVGYNTKIDTINTYIDTKFAGREGFAIVDVKNQLAPQGQLLTTYTLPNDGCHLNATGYDILKPAIRDALTSLNV